MRILVTGGSGFIGTCFISAATNSGHTVCNFDRVPPRDSRQSGAWFQGDILSVPDLRRSFETFSPECVVHLAARAECDENTTVEDGYRANTDGTKNLLEVVKGSASVKRAVITSSQFVCGPGHVPTHDEDFSPVTVYGRSKVITEQLTRASRLACCWTLVRPTNIWGPWHDRYEREFWRAVKKGFYVHPAGPPVVRCYGFVGNVADQILRILGAPESEVNGRVLYLGDPPRDIREWVNAFSNALKGRPAMEVPRPILTFLGLLGGGIERVLGRSFYINPSRVRSMMSDYVVPMKPTYQLLGQPRFSLDEGVEQTVFWLKERDDFWK